MAEEKDQNGSGDNVNGDADTSQLHADIIKQIEYYFGDMNLPRDKFLQDQIKLDDGWVPLEILTKFHRLAKLSTDTKIIAEALLKATSGLLQLNDNNTKVRRNPEMPLPELNEERRKEIQERSVYVKGFPQDSTIDTILTFFKDYPKVENVIMRKYQNRETKKWMFKGSVFATFSAKEEAESFIKHDNLKFNDKELIVKWQLDYIKGKQLEYQARKEKKEKKNQSKQEEEKQITLPTGSVLQFSLEDDNVKRESIRDAFTKIEVDVAFIDFNSGDKEGWVRFKNENEALEVFKKLNDGKLTVGEAEISFKLPEKEQEVEFLKNSAQQMTRKRKNNSNQRGKNNQRHGKKRKMQKN